MIKKKEFSILELEKEARYLESMASDGYVFKSYQIEGHEFESGPQQKLEYRVEYTLDPLESSQMFDLVDSYHSSKGGYYSYLIRREAGDFVSNGDRVDLIEMQKNRIDRFTSIVLGGVIVLFAYMFITQQNPIYLLIVFLGLVMGAYVLINRQKMIKVINSLK